MVKTDGARQRLTNLDGATKSAQIDVLFLGGFGRAILGLAALMLLLYLLVIYEEAKKNTIFQKWLLLDTVAGLWNGHENRPSQIL